jgi:hypothetical protein
MRTLRYVHAGPGCDADSVEVRYRDHHPQAKK